MISMVESRRQTMNCINRSSIRIVNGQQHQEDDDVQQQLRLYESSPHKLLNVKCVVSMDIVTHMDLSYSNLKTVPKDVTNMKNLKTLDLSHNQIGEISVYDKNNFISSADNPLQSIKNIMNMNPYQSSLSVESLNLDFNQITICNSTLVSIGNMFPSLSKLSATYQSRNNQLNLVNSSRNIEQLVISSIYLPKLSYLNLSGNRLFNLQKMDGNQVVTSLILHSNGLKVIPTFSDCDLVNCLDLSNNNIRNIEERFEELILSLPNLRNLDFSGNFDASLRNFPTKLRNLCKSMDVIKVEPIFDYVRIAFNNTFNDCRDNCVIIHNIGSQRCPSDGRRDKQQLLIGLINGSNLASVFKREIPKMFESQLQKLELNHNQKSVDNDLSKKALNSCFDYIEDMINNQDDDDHINNLNSPKRGDGLNIILCHLIVPDDDKDGVHITLSFFGSKISLETLIQMNEPSTTTMYNNDKLISVNNLIKDKIIEDEEKELNYQKRIRVNPVTKSVVIKDKSSLLLLGINSKVKSRKLTESRVHKNGDLNTIYDYFHDSKIKFGEKFCLDTKLKKFSESIKTLTSAPTPPTTFKHFNDHLNYSHESVESSGHIVMAIQRSMFDTFDTCCDPSDYPEKFRSWDYILQENDRKELYTRTPSETPLTSMETLDTCDKNEDDVSKVSKETLNKEEADDKFAALKISLNGSKNSFSSSSHLSNDMKREVKLCEGVNDDEDATCTKLCLPVNSNYVSVQETSTLTAATTTTIKGSSNRCPGGNRDAENVKGRNVTYIQTFKI